jgi:diaminopimelate decarboxylase
MTRHGMPVHSVNVGGGFGVDYSAPAIRFDVGRYGAALTAQPLIDDLGLDSITIDLGRFLVAAAGYYVTEIIDIKHAGTSIHLVTAGGINHQRRPYAHDCNMPMSILPCNRAPSRAAVHETEVTVNGPTLASYDVLGRNVWVGQADVGDLLILGLAGAYGLNLAPVEFLLRPKAEEHVMNRAKGPA